MTLEQTSLQDYESTANLHMEEQRLTTADVEECSFIVEDICTELSHIDANKWECHGDVSDEVEFLTDGPGFETAKEVHEIMCRYTSNTLQHHNLRRPFTIHAGKHSNYHDYHHGHLYGRFGPIDVAIEYAAVGQLYVSLAGSRENKLYHVPIYIGPLDEDGLHLIRSALQAYRTRDYHVIDNEPHLSKSLHVPQAFLIPSSGATD